MKNICTECNQVLQPEAGNLTPEERFRITREINLTDKVAATGINNTPDTAELPSKQDGRHVYIASETTNNVTDERTAISTTTLAPKKEVKPWSGALLGLMRPG